ncbi:MAG: Fe-S protein assembly co-chaperone HscB, partial [Burkholderiales bacterium]
KFSHAGEAEKRLSMQWATRANEAYQTLKKPLSRARYLLQLQGVDTQEETNTAMPTGFLIEQMEWREAVMEAKLENNHKSLINLKKKLYSQRAEMLGDLERLIDADKDLTAACVTTRKLRFLEKLAEEIDDAIESAED